MPKRAAGQRPGQVVITDPRAIRALAHPARLAVLEALNGRELTATGCAELTGLSPSAMSYHLRALEKWGIVERAEGTGDGRLRPWRLRGEGVRVETEGLDGSEAAGQLLGEALLDSEWRHMRSFTARRDQEPPEWVRAATWSDLSAWMTVEQAQQLTDQVAAFIEKCRGPGGERPAGTRRVRVSYKLIPLGEPPEPAAPSPDRGSPAEKDAPPTGKSGSPTGEG